jgi:hypothetical protein
MVKIYWTDQIIREQKCFTKTCSSHINKQENGDLILRKKTDWNYLIPQEQQ